MRPLHGLSAAEIKALCARAAQTVADLGPDATHAVELDVAASAVDHPEHGQALISAIGGTWVRAWVFVPGQAE